MKANMIKPMTKSTYAFKPLTLAIALAIGVAATNALAEDAMEAANSNAANSNSVQDTYNNANWQTPLAIEFTNLDTSGNGLLLPNEASKGKAFNKQTFAKADADHDGYIDQNEYAYHKTGKWPEVAKPVNSGAANNAVINNDAMGEELFFIAAAESEAAAPSKRSVGMVIDDSIITAKAKAEILGTKELKSLQISVETRQGDVILSGFVDNEAAKLKAEEVVSKIEGVKSITNGLEVKS